MNKKKKSTNTSPYPDEAIERLARAFYPAILACWNSEEGQRSLVGGKAPPSCLRKTVRSLKSPTGAFIDSLRSSNANCFNFICNFMAAAFFQLSRIINTSFSIVDVEQNASFFAAVSDGTAQFKKVGCFIKLFCESTIQSCHENGPGPRGNGNRSRRTLKIEYAASGTSRQ